MFTGIIEEVGTIKNISQSGENTLFTIETKNILEDKKIGDSIALNGACLTITKIDGNSYECEAIPETLKLTNLGDLKEGALINLESAAKIGSRLDGHIVQGHIDCTGTVKNFDNNILTATYPEKIQGYLAFKASVTLNGVSLTISKVTDTEIEVSLIPHTLEHTNLGQLKPGDKINIEVDIFARYIESLLNSKEKESKYHFLKERGFI